MKKSKLIVSLAVAVLVMGILIFLFWPGHLYIRRALVHWYPKIDQYPLFEHRVVKAKQPFAWTYAKNSSQNTVDKKFIKDFEKYKTVAFLVVQHGEILQEQYWDGYGPTSYSNSFSMAKSIVSMLVSCAISDGYIQGVNQAVSDFLPRKEWDSYEGKPLLIKDLLTMSAGVEWNETSTDLFSSTTEAYYGNDLWKLVKTEKLIEKPGVYFNYQSGVTQLLAFVLVRAIGKPLSVYASEKIWTPIQAEEDALWSLDRADGMEKAYCCFNSNVRDFARLGQLVLNHGRWKGKVVVDSAYLAQATTEATYLQYRRGDGKIVPCTMYGYQFWKLKYQGLDVTYFRGILGQYIFVIPALDAVVVRLGEERSSQYNLEQDYPTDIDIWLDAALSVLETKRYR